MGEAAVQRPKIIVTYNESIVTELELEGEEVTIGRKPGNTLVLDDAAVSGQHARVVKIQSVFFLEDLKSTNGTFINETRIDRQQLKDRDVVSIGKHRLLFREHNAQALRHGSPDSVDPDKTVILKGQRRGEMGNETCRIAVLQVVGGKTDRKEYHLNSKLTIIGAQDNAAVKLRGWFAPKVAAMIGRRGEGYYITASEEGRKVQVNDRPVRGQSDLNDGDLIEVAGVKLYFCLKES
ncbi:FHA domain-containing protein [Candidatus Nitrospira bockiana]